MSGAGFEHLPDLIRTAVCILLMGGVIRLMDDFLDLRYDVFEGALTLATRLGEGTLPYTLLGFAIAVMLDSQTAAALMAGAYAVGMAGDFDRQLPSGLAGYQEGALALVAALVFLPLATVVWALFAMFSVQVFDDLDDLAVDQRTGNPNIARRWGIMEARMAAIAGLVAAGLIMPIETAAVYVVVPVVGWSSRIIAKPIAKTRGWIR